MRGVCRQGSGVDELSLDLAHDLLRQIHPACIHRFGKAHKLRINRLI
jgi:hypothetical protein